MAPYHEPPTSAQWAEAIDLLAIRAQTNPILNTLFEQTITQFWNTADASQKEAIQARMLEVDILLRSIPLS